SSALCPLDRRDPTRVRYGPPVQPPARLDLLVQRPDFLFPPAAARLRVLAAAGFFLVSAPMLARSASMRLTTRAGVASSFGCWITRPACLARSNSTSAVS